MFWGLIFLWEELMYSVMENVPDFFFIITLSILLVLQLWIPSPKLKSAPLSNGAVKKKGYSVDFFSFSLRFDDVEDSVMQLFLPTSRAYHLLTTIYHMSHGGGSRNSHSWRLCDVLNVSEGTLCSNTCSINYHANAFCISKVGGFWSKSAKQFKWL